MSAWQDEQKQLALELITQARRHGRRIIPVILPGGCREDVEGFIRLRAWVEFAEPYGFDGLVAGIRGRPPGPPSHLTRRG